MGSDRFYCPGFRTGQRTHLEGDEARHLVKVRRVTMGAEVEIFNGTGAAAVATVTAIGRDRVELQVERSIPSLPDPVLHLTLAVAIPKGDRFDWLVEKATELGVARLVPLQTERSTVDPRSAKIDRIRRAVIESCKQCRRNHLMVIDDPISWERWAVIPADPTTSRWLAHPGGQSAWGADRVERGSNAMVAIGPEGGFTPREVALAEAVHWRTIQLTSTILRIETAAMAVSAYLLLGGNTNR